MEEPNTQERYEYLASKWKNNSISQAEEYEFLNWLNAHDGIPLNVPVSFSKSEEALKSGIYEEISGSLGLVKQRKLRLWPKAAVAAAAVTALTLSIWLYYTTSRVSKDYSQNVVQQNLNNIVPGRNGATLTLANGKVIQLSDGKKGVIVGSDLKYDDGTEVQFSPDSLQGSPSSTGPLGDHSVPGAKNSMMMTAQTAKGQVYEFTLSDGTHVFLNADSKIIFPSQFSGKARNISLNGEAYLEVAKDTSRPFFVEAGGQQIQVLGTHFDVNAYQDEGVVRTTLLEGSIKISTKSGAGLILKPNEQAILRGASLSSKLVIAESFTEWKEGIFYFEDEDLQSVMRKLSRWYDVSIEYKDGMERENMKINGSVSRYEHISQALDIIGRSVGVSFKLTGRKVIVYQ